MYTIPGSLLWLQPQHAAHPLDAVPRHLRSARLYPTVSLDPSSMFGYSKTPGMRRSCEDLRPGLFSFPVGKHVLFDRVQPGGIVLVRVIHGARDLRALVGATEP
jgi:hypothetical protein